MERKQWNEVLDEYLERNTMTPEDYETLNEIQQSIIQEIKKSIKRIKYDNNKKL